MYRKNVSKIIGLGLAALIMVGCAAPSVETSILMPAKQPNMTNAKRLGIAPLSGDRDNRYTSKLQAFIGNIQVKGAPYFTLVDIDRDTIMREQRLSDTALFDAKTAVELGRLVAADTILSGAVKPPKYKKSRSVEERKKCVKGEKNEYSDTYIKCEKYDTYVVICATQTMRFGMTLRATNVATGTVAFIQDYADEARHHYCIDNGVERNKDALADEAIAKLLQTVRMDIAPYPVRFTIQFLDYDAKSGLGGKSVFFEANAQAKAAFESGLKLAEKNQAGLACEQFRKAAGLFNGSPAIFHNLGVCSELDGNFDKAIAFYEQSTLVAPAPIDVTLTALARAKRNKSTSAAANAQLR